LGDPDGMRSGHPAVVSGVVVDAVKQVTAFLVDGSEFSDGPQLQVYGSGNLIQTLVRHNLVDQPAVGLPTRYRLGQMQHPSREPR
jgi:hypothetical protein